MKFIPKVSTMYAGVENKIKNCTGPPQKGINSKKKKIYKIKCLEIILRAIYH